MVIFKKEHNKLMRKEALEGYLFALPWIIGFFTFTLGPMIASFFLSFCRYSGIGSPQWIGLENFKVLFHDPLFWKSLYNTFYYTISVPLGMIVAMVCALLLTRKIPGVNLFRTAYFMPVVTSGVAVAFLWMLLLDPNIGLINAFLERIGIMGPLWLQSEAWSKPALILMSLWSVGATIVIYIAGLEGIPRQLYEAAEIDGASRIDKFVHITLPMMSPTIFFTLVMGLIGSFQIFTQAYVMTNGGPLNSTLFYVLYLYRMGFIWLHMGTASAMAWILFLIILGLTLLVIKSSPMWVYYEARRGKI